MVKEKLIELLIIALLGDEISGGVGNNNNVQGNAKWIAAENKAFYLEINNSDINKVNEKIKHNSDKMIIIIGCGDKSAEMIKKISGNNIRKVILTHQASEKILSSIDNFDIIAIPRHVLKGEHRIKLDKKLVEVIGASSNLTTKEIDENYERMKNQLQSGKEVFAILFGGDATLADGSKKILSEENAKELGIIIGKKALERGANIQITDGPRTGAYLGREDGKMNNVIKAFKEGIESVNTGSKISYFPFIQDKVKREANPSAYKAFLKKSDQIFYTMDSISTGVDLAIIKDLVGKGVAVESESTLPEHKEFASFLHKEGYINLIEIENGEVKEHTLNKPADKPLDQNYNAILLNEAILKPIGLTTDKHIEL